MKFEHELIGDYRAQFVEESGRLWASKAYDLYYSDNFGESFLHRARLDVGSVKGVLSRWALPNRFLRAGFLSMRPLEDGSLLGVVYGGIVRCEAGSDSFMPVLQRPGRTMKIEAVDKRTILAGEYFYNKARGSVDVMCSDDGGRTWHDAYRFRSGEIRHIHSIMFDKRSSSLLVLCGDTDKESKIIITDDRFHALRVLSEGTQRSRAAAILPTQGGYFIATDTPYEQNYIQFLSYDGELTIRCPIAGSSLGGCQVGAWSFFATAAEPSPVNHDPSVAIYGSRNGVEWSVVHRWRADHWSWPTGIQAGLFQMSRALFPAGDNRTNMLFATTIAVRQSDGVLHRWLLPVI